MVGVAVDINTKRKPWKGFTPGLWQKEINVRDFIQQNYTPYDGDESFLAPATERTRNIWARLNELFVEERKKGVLDVSQIPSSITAHAPGSIDRDNEVIVGLQKIGRASCRERVESSAGAGSLKIKRSGDVRPSRGCRSRGVRR